MGESGDVEDEILDSSHQKEEGFTAKGKGQNNFLSPRAVH